MVDRLITILLVEDNDAHALLVQHALEQIGPTLRMLHVPDGVHGMQYLRGEAPYDDLRESPRPDLILLDLNLPGADGFEVLEMARAQEETLYVPIVVFSSSESREDIRRAYAAGANGYVVKPIGYAAFKDVLENTVAFWGGCNRVP